MLKNKVAPTSQYWDAYLRTYLGCTLDSVAGTEYKLETCTFISQYDAACKYFTISILELKLGKVGRTRAQLLLHFYCLFGDQQG